MSTAIRKVYHTHLYPLERDSHVLHLHGQQVGVDVSHGRDERTEEANDDKTKQLLQIVM